MRSTKGLAFTLTMGLLTALASPAEATNPAPGCMGMGVGLLNAYFDEPWSQPEIAKFATAIAQPSAAAFWGVEKQDDKGHVDTILSAGGGLRVTGQDTAFAIYQPLGPPRLIPGYDYLLVEVLARIYVKQGAIGIALTAGPASFADPAYPRAPFRSTITGEWTSVGVQVMVSANSIPYDRVSIVSLGKAAEFSLGCITFITHERNIGVPDPGPPTKGTMLLAPGKGPRRLAGFTTAPAASGLAVIQQQ